MTTTHADKFRAAQADAALTEMEAQRAFERHLEDVLDIARSPRQRLLAVIRIGDDAVVSITGLAGETLWGAVVDDKRPPTYVYTQDEALVQPGVPATRRAELAGVPLRLPHAERPRSRLTPCAPPDHGWGAAAFKTGAPA